MTRRITPEIPGIHANEIGRLKRKTEIASGFAASAAEMNAAPFPERITTLPTSLSRFKELYHPGDNSIENQVTGLICQWAEETEPSIRIWTTGETFKEVEILSAMKDFIKDGSRKVLVWASPPSPGLYRSSRINIYEVLEVDGKKYIFSRSLCSPYSAEECLNIAQNFGCQINDPEELRMTPLEIVAPKNTTLIDFLERAIGMEECWQAVRQGKDIRMNVEAFLAAKQIEEWAIPLIAQAKTPCERAQIGWLIERELKTQLQRRFAADGFHGLPYEQAIGILAANPEMILINKNKKEHCGQCHSKNPNKAFGKKFGPDELCRPEKD